MGARSSKPRSKSPNAKSCANELRADDVSAVVGKHIRKHSPTARARVDVAALYSHDATLRELACATALIRKAIAEFMEDTNLWLARERAREETKKFCISVEQSVMDAKTRREIALRGACDANARRAECERDFVHQARGDDDDVKDMELLYCTREMKDAREACEKRIAIASAEEETRRASSDVCEEFATRAKTLHEKAQGTFEKRLESCFDEHERARYNLMDAEKRFGKLQSHVDKKKMDKVPMDVHKDLAAVEVEINAQIAQCERFEAMLKTRCEEYLQYFTPELKRLVFTYATSKVTANETANDVTATSIDGGVPALFATQSAMREADSSAIDAAPSPPKLKAVSVEDEVEVVLPRTPANTPIVVQRETSASASDQELEEGEIGETAAAKVQSRVEASASVAAA